MPEHVLVPIDRSEQSRTALAFAVDEHPDATITLLHIIDLGNLTKYGDEGYFFSDDFVDQLRQRGRELLDENRTQARERVDGIKIETELRMGSPARTITEYVDTHDVDHVVMGSHGRHGVSRVLIGSVAETVTRRSPVPVTIVR
ncbi:universal stress protein [Natrialba sp. SSL1]|uniref:universal stress protein n=1 Tax=Natrialba sp. SSL1 TaxID=1869245 RepID=UPI0008F81C28|nr:universal stress protein [Natrialba sp. SSL1]OIB55464.1 universal stress protein UspA [Natrialba sp. SSL1]